MKKSITPLFLIFFLGITINLFSMPPFKGVLDNTKKNHTQKKTISRYSRGINTPGEPSCPTTGTVYLPVILIDFSPLSQRMNYQSTPSFYTNLLNENGNNLTMNKYYKDMSNNKLNVIFEIFGPYHADNELSYYGANETNGDVHPGELVAEAVQKADSDVNFSRYDNNHDGTVDAVIVVHQGAGEERTNVHDQIWSHHWDLYSAGVNGDGPGIIIQDGVKINGYTMQPEYMKTAGDATIGVFCHEFGHVLGLPDLYDTSIGQDGLYKSDGVGNWTLMSGGAWGGPADKEGSMPVPLLAWERQQLGWISVVTPEQASATFSLPIDFKTPENLFYIFLGINFIFIATFFRKKYLKFNKIAIMFSIAILLIGGCMAYHQISLEDIDSSYQAIKITSGYNFNGNEQYLLLENKLRKTGTWSQYLPGDGLLITYIDNYIVNAGIASNTVNALSPHGVQIIEADNKADLESYTSSENNAGDTTDPFYLGNNNTFDENSSPAATYREYNSSGTSYSTHKLNISVKINSAPGKTVSLDIGNIQ